LPYYVYILASRTKTLYVGVTNNLERRVWEHKTDAVPSFSGRYKIHKLVYYEEYRSIRDAINREKQIKAWRREKKVHLVESLNPEWDDMAEHWYTGLRDPSLRSE
jgi:putative endonuclease